MFTYYYYLARGGYYHQVGRVKGLAESSAMVNLQGSRFSVQKLKFKTEFKTEVNLSIG